MNARIVTAIGIALVFFILYSWYSTKDQDGFSTQLVIPPQYQPVNEEEVSKPAIEDNEERQVTSSGPHSPAQAPSKMMPPIIQPDEIPFDPYADTFESAEIPERLRHPERSFGPGLVNDSADFAIQSGIANLAQQTTTRSYQSFGPEFATNGGSFLDNGVTANDTDMPMGYSSV